MRLGKFGEQLVLSGDVVYYKFIVTLQEGNEDEAWGRLIDVRRRQMEDEMNFVTRGTLGSEFAVRSVTPVRGSIEILVVIGTTLAVISKYKSFIDSLELLKEQLEKLVKGFFPVGNKVSSLMTLAPALSITKAPSSEAFDSNKIVLFYLILSHAALLVVLIWLLIKRLGTP